MLLEGKVALVTGGASGIGKATANLFAKEGAAVVVVDYNQAGGQATVDEIHRAGGDAIFVYADVGKMEYAKAMVEATAAHYNRLDVVFSNAASYVNGDPFEITEGDWEYTLNVCLKATWMIAHHAVPLMMTHGGGTIVLTGSVHAIRGYKGATAYQAAKGGMLALTRSLAGDLAPTIRVNTILPGAIETGLWDGMDQTRRDEVAKRCILRRNGMPEDVAKVALFLASDMSSYVTATSVVVDGGLTAIIE